MELCDLITEIERGDFSHAQEADFSLVGNIMSEIEVAKENPARARLFRDAKQLNDVIIEPYLRLDEAVKQEMAEVYEQEKCFRRLGGIQSETKLRLEHKIGKENLLLIGHISNYSKLITMIQNYISWVENYQNPNPRDMSPIQYFGCHNIIGQKVPKHRKGSLKAIHTYDFKNGMTKKNQNKTAIINSLLYGIPEKLKTKFMDATALIPVRKKILDNYLAWTQQFSEPTSGQFKLTSYLSTHSLDGQRVKAMSMESLCNFSLFNFRTWKRQKFDSQELVIDSLCFGLNEEYRELIFNTAKMVPQRIQILRNYNKWVLNNMDLKPGSSVSFIKYLRTHSQSGEEVDVGSKGSLTSFSIYDFKLDKTRSEFDFDSFSYSLPILLKEETYDSMALVSHRIKILKDYVSWVEEQKGEKSSLLTYLHTHDIHARLGKSRGEINNLRAFSEWNFCKGKRQIKQNHQTIFESLIYLIKDSELVEKVRKYALPKAA